GTERVLGAAGHLFGKPWVAFAHFGGRIPVGPGLLAADGFRAGPVEALASDRDLIAVGALVGQYVVERPRPGIDHDRVGGICSLEGHGCGGHRRDVGARPANSIVIDTGARALY